MLDKSIKQFSLLSNRHPLRTLVEGALQECKFTGKFDCCPDFESFQKLLRTDVRKAFVIDSAYPWAKSLQGGLYSVREITLGQECFSILCTAQIEKELIAAAMEHNISKVILEKQTNSALFAFQLKSLSDGLVNPKPFHKMLLALERAMAANKHDEADKFASQLFTYFPEQPRSRLEYAEHCLRTEKQEEANAHGTQLLKEQPLFLGAVTLLAKLRFAQGNIPEGIKLIVDAEAVSPGSPVRLMLLGDFHSKAGNLEKAEECYEQVQASLTGYLPASLGLARTQMTRDQSLSMVSKHQAVLGDDNMARALNMAAVELVRRGEMTKSIELYQICVSIITDPVKRNRVKFNMALAQIRSGQLPAATKALEEILAVEPEFEKAKEALKKIASQGQSL